MLTRLLVDDLNLAVNFCPEAPHDDVVHADGASIPPFIGYSLLYWRKIPN